MPRPGLSFRIVALAIAPAVAIALGGCLHVTPAPAPTHEFLERNYVFRDVRDTSLMYEAQAAAHLFLVDGLPDAYASISDAKHGATAGAWRVILSPMFLIRQLHDSSSAVRTPTFMPRVSVERTWASRLGRVDTLGDAVMFDHAMVGGVRLSLTHESNGQAGCFREGFEPSDAHANKCVPKPGYDTNVVALNRADGDFSTTYLGLMLHSTWRNGNTADLALWSAGIALEGDYHLPHIFGALSDEQRQLYGSWRAVGAIDLMKVLGHGCDTRPHGFAGTVGCYLRGRARLTAQGEKAPKDPGPLALRIEPRIVPWRYNVELSQAFDALLRMGVFVRWSDGQDYYNIGFAQRRTILAFGLMLDASGADRIGPKGRR